MTSKLHYGDRREVVGGGKPGGAAASGPSRWNPTKEQIEILEGMYKQGIRTPAAEQIQQITARLREYGHIEGKNVFYWFQNHKARQRQKERQENLAVLSRCLPHRPQSAAPSAAAFRPSPWPNVICGPCLMPPTELGFYPILQYPTVLLPCGSKRRQRPGLMESMAASRGFNVSSHWHGNFFESGRRIESGAVGAAAYGTNRRTLDLFPLHPTGIEGGSMKEASDVPGCSSQVRQSV
ncbi:hypothetical protein SAY86_002073 [Trapa natans]|uniref:Homeobox domain-containing protein n=1 Tax=Trapa natans TaxID=22666 RepID=A0AAN7LJN3_TRANT|nr:hypothetical protein SAY86_002073 [Trapa natans]